MAYQKKGKKFGRKRDQRRQLFRSLARSIILHERISTTEARAKAVRPYLEKLVTRAKTDTLPNRRLLLAELHNDSATVQKLITTLGTRYAERKGGYVRILKVTPRQGSGRSSAIIEFV